MELQDLLDYIKENFPDGCSSIECKDCVLNAAETLSNEKEICIMISEIKNDGWMKRS